MKKYTAGVRKKRLEKKIKKNLFLYFFPTFLIFDLFLLLFNLNYLAVKNIEVDILEKKYLDKKEIKIEVQKILYEKYYSLFSKANYVFYPKGEIINDLKEKFKDIKKIEIRNQEYFNSIKIKIEEEKPSYYFCENLNLNKCYNLSVDGKIFEKIKIKKNKNKIFIAKDLKEGDYFFNLKEERSRVFKLINFLDEVVKNRVKTVIKKNSYFYIFVLENGTRLILNSDFNNEEIILKINKFLEKNKTFSNIAYIDLSLSRRINYCIEGDICQNNFKK